jgi:hypothetical protein
MIRLIALFFLPLMLFATVNEPLRWELLSGYRNDHLHWHLNPNVGMQQSEQLKDIEFWENQLTYRVIHRDIVFFINAGYSAFGRGTIQETLSDLPFTQLPQQFRFPTKGWALDGSSFLGYAVNLTADRTYKVLLIPLIGYSAHYLKVRGKGSQSSPEVSVSFPKPLQQLWYGFFVGGGFRVLPGNRLIFDVGYEYHWLHLNFKSQFQELFGSSEQLNKLTAKRGSNLGHSGWAKIDYILDRYWTIGAAGSLNYYVSQHFTTKQKQTLTPPDSQSSIPGKFKLRWTSFSLLFSVSREV